MKEMPIAGKIGSTGCLHMIMKRRTGSRGGYRYALMRCQPDSNGVFHLSEADVDNETRVISYLEPDESDREMLEYAMNWLNDI
jgi:hypothetical protein